MLNVLSCLLAICKVCKSFACLLGCLRLLFVEILYTFWMTILHWMNVTAVFVHYCLPFHSLNGISWWAEIPNFNVVQLSLVLLCLFKNFCLHYGHAFFWVFYSFTSHKSITYLKLIFVYSWASGQDWSVFARWIITFRFLKDTALHMPV